MELAIKTLEAELARKLKALDRINEGIADQQRSLADSREARSGWIIQIAELEAALALLRQPESAPAVRPWAFPAFLGDGLVSKGRGDGGTAGMPQSFSMSMTGVTVEGSAGNLSGLPDGMAGYEPLSNPLPGAAGALADRPELATPLNTQPLRDPPYCDRCERPLGPGHACLAAEADAARFTALPSSRRPDRTTGEDSQEL